MKENILLVEDEEALRTTLSDRLRGEGYVVDTAADGQDGFEKATNLPFDLIILDIMLPYRNGLEVCRDIRQAGLATPILFLTVRDATVDKVIGLKLGGDDYLTKPFKALELLARIEALLRRTPKRAPGAAIHQFGSIRVDARRREVTRNDKPVYLTEREFELLEYLIERAGSIVPRSEILRHVWGYDTGAFTRTVDVHVASLRQKLEQDPKRPKFLVTVTGVGYKLTAFERRGPARQ